MLPFLDALPIYPRRWRAARKTVMPVAPTNARVPMRPRVSRADAPPARVRRASAKTHAPSAKTIAAVDLARVGSGTSSNRPYVHMINNCNVCKYNVILTASAQYDKLSVY